MVSPFATTAVPDLAAVLAVAFVLGLRHATDPDHLVAVTSLVAGARRLGARAAARLGAAWGAGHALTLLLLGLPVVLLGVRVPERLQQVAEAAIGAVIVLLGVQLLRRWRRGAFHVHTHDHGGLRHVHVHSHAEARAHGHEHARTRSGLAAFAIGCLHGIGGSAAVGILLVARQDTSETAALALAVLAAGTAVSMALLSGALGFALAARHVRRRMMLAVPAFGTWGVLFGAWYGFAAWNVVPYPL
jgi:ABC-type nickel/cobalt efflux system permease component RcnA